VPVPDGVAATEAAALGTAGLAAWIPLTRLTRITAEDTVLVFGASGAVGQVAIQAARLLGAGRVVGAGRNTKKLAGLPGLGADATVNLSDEGDLAAAFVRACGDIRPTVVFDPLWGPPVLAALEAAATGARVLHLGQSAAPDVAIPSGLVRGKSLKIFGCTTLNVTAQEVTDSYRELVTELAHGHIHIRIDATTVRSHTGPRPGCGSRPAPEPSPLSALESADRLSGTQRAPQPGGQRGVRGAPSANCGGKTSASICRYRSLRGRATASCHIDSSSARWPTLASCRSRYSAVRVLSPPPMRRNRRRGRALRS
jgi:Zinc-binding dehydrogenase